MSILYGIITFFVIIGFIAPFVNDEFGGNAPVYDLDTLDSGIDAESTSAIGTAFEVFVSIVSMFFWNFNLPVWMNAIIFLPIRIIFILLVTKVIRGTS